MEWWTTSLVYHVDLIISPILCSGGSNEPPDFNLYKYIIFFISLILKFILKNIIFAHPDLNFIYPYYKYFQL